MESKVLLDLMIFLGFTVWLAISFLSVVCFFVSTFNPPTYPSEAEIKLARRKDNMLAGAFLLIMFINLALLFLGNFSLKEVLMNETMTFFEMGNNAEDKEE